MKAPASIARDARRRLAQAYPWMKSPFLIAAPMRVMAGPRLAVTVSSAGGLGFIGPGARAEDTLKDLEKAKELLQGHPQLSSHNGLLPVGIGFQVWNGDLKVAAKAVETYRPCATWLFAPRNGQIELNEWASTLRTASPKTQVWIQVGTLDEAVEASESATPPDVLVIQGAEAGGHGRSKDSIGLIALLPEVSDAIHRSGIPLIAAGGIADGRGVAAALSLGAAGVAMGTRMLATTEATISKGYQNEVVRATDAAKSTVRTHLYNHLRGTFGWPEFWAPRTLVNRSFVDQEAGVLFEELKKLHDEAVKTGDAAWGPEGRVATYVGAGVGLVRSVEDAAVVIGDIRDEANQILSTPIAKL